MFQLNARAANLVCAANDAADHLRIAVSNCSDTQILDFGVDARGGLDAGLLLARICMSDLAEIRLLPPNHDLRVPRVQVSTDHPVEACLLSQYAGWKIAADDYFAMGSGPMRILAGAEDLQKELKGSDNSGDCVGVLEAGSLPTPAAIQFIRDAVGNVSRLSLLVAPTASLAGTVQVVARSVETALHKLHDLKFPLNAIVSGTGISPLPPVAKNDLQGIGRTNDAILYGATVNLWVDCDDDVIEELGPGVPSDASDSHGRTFEDLFAEAGQNFYKMDPKLFSPAVVVFHNLKSGRTFDFGRHMSELLEVSFGLSGV